MLIFPDGTASKTAVVLLPPRTKACGLRGGISISAELALRLRQGFEIGRRLFLFAKIRSRFSQMPGCRLRESPERPPTGDLKGITDRKRRSAVFERLSSEHFSFCQGMQKNPAIKEK